MTPQHLLRDAADTAMGFKETYTADNGVSDLHPALFAYDAHGNRMVAVMLASLDPNDVGTAAIALVAAWQPWALAFVCEGYVKVVADDAPECDDPDWSPTRAFASGDPEVHEAVCVALHVRHQMPVGIAMPFRYLTGHVVEWIDAGELTEGNGGSVMGEVLDAAIDVEPMRGVSLAQARIECIDFLRDRGCVVIT